MYRIYGFERTAPLTTRAILARIHPDDADLLSLAPDGRCVISPRLTPYLRPSFAIRPRIRPTDEWSVPRPLGI